jgi:hypothetical protein
MTELTRRRDPDRQRETWLIFYGDVHVGTIGLAVGNPGAVPRWTWHCGFYPGSNPGEQMYGSEESFEDARVAFERTWASFLARRTEADFQAWRDQRDWTARKYAMWERGEKLPPQRPSPLMRCPCGQQFDSHRLEHNLIHVPHITEHQREVRNRSTVC